MGPYIAKRFLISIPVLFIISVVNFGFFHMAPGDPALMMLPPTLEGQEGVNEEELLAMHRKRLGLDRPLPVQYLAWLRELATGNFGRSMLSGRPVSTVIKERIGPTLQLTLVALIAQLAIGLTVGVVSAVRRNTWIDYLSTLMSFIAVSVPNFFLGLVFVYIFALKLKWFPTSGASSVDVSWSFIGSLRYVVLPALVIGLSAAAVLVRYTRSSMLEVLRMDYVNTARSKGLPERRVILGHALRNGLLPVITVVSLYLPVLVGGSIVVEQVFFWPGIGTLAIGAVNGRDYPVLMAINMMFAGMVMLANLLADVAYAFVDPRIRY